jgi:hypothetical protein
MRTLLLLALLLAPAPGAAQADADSLRDSFRVSRLVGHEIFAEEGDLKPLIQRRKAVQLELQRLVHTPSPDMVQIDRLRAEEHELSTEILAVTYRATNQALSKLTPAERLSYIRLEYPQPVQVKTLPHPDRFFQRNGETEALAEIRAGKPTRLYSHVYNGRAPGFATPGIRRCDQSRSGAQAIFVPLPEADWGEGPVYTGEKAARAASALKFAKAYNQTMFRARKADVLVICPNAGLDD